MKDLFTSFKDNCGFGLLASIDNIPSHQNLEDSITSLSRMMHRGAIAADGKTGDGSGLLLSIPRDFFKKEAAKNNIILPEIYAVAMVFLQNESDMDIIHEACANNDLKIIFTRDVPVDIDALGEQALASLPDMKQIFVIPNALVAVERFDALIYLTRKEIEHKIKDDKRFYIPSFSSSVISYKGLIMPTQIKKFYKDMQDSDFKISFALFHQRFSTNTLPEWRLAQPFRAVAHNGEINSVEANRFNVATKIKALESTVFTSEEMNKISDIIQSDMSDSASLDNFLEFLHVNNVDFFQAARSVIPAPWHNAPYMDAKLKAFYEYVSASYEPWDGPAAVSMTNGRYIGCVLDRNGLRPAKYIITKDNKLLISSEFGVVNMPEENILKRGRLKSGEMMGLDLKYHRVLTNTDIDNYLKNKDPYEEWLNKNMSYLQEHAHASTTIFPKQSKEIMEAKQRYFNYTSELIKEVIKPMVKEGKETTASMGDDTPLAAFSTEHRKFSDFFKQKFAQVTNPPIDPIREKVVMSLNTGFGQTRNILKDSSENAKRLKTVSPIMSREKFQLLKEFGTVDNERYDVDYKYQTYSTVFKSDLRESLNILVDTIIADVRDNGVRVIILDDREMRQDEPAMPINMVVGKLADRLLEENLKNLTNIVAVTGEVFDPHSAAVLMGYGATSLFPYLLYYTVKNITLQDNPEADIRSTLKRFRRAMSAGLMKIMSKMGISTMSSYRNARLFDVIGLSQEIVSDCFNGSRGLLGGLEYEDIEQRLFEYANSAYTDIPTNKKSPLDKGGYYKYKKDSEYHDFSRSVINSIIKLGTTGKKDDYNHFKTLVNNRDKKFIRDFYNLKSDKDSIALDDVESIESIYKRFSTAAMSLGSMSPEAHECLAAAMNTIGAKSNSGEGGEDAARFDTILNSKIKQVASGRFGVTPAYLRSAEEIQIKVAQGAKPGEGGQLPGSKVTPLIAKLRCTKPGVTLISPPPHHDIYSIEDLAQLIFDLKQVNPNAKISVKLVSSAGVGTIAAGVAKCYADKIIISGADGGTGAAPIGSVRHAGNPWELGLIEAHNALKANNLRGQVTLETDGGLKTGLDVIKAAIFGAEEYAFGTAALAIVGCIMCRSCHTNKCPVGITTQDDKLRAKFDGTVEKVINYFRLLAEDTREILASLGYSTIEEIVGRVDLLEVIDDEFAKKFSFDKILYRLDGVDTAQVESNEPYDDNAYEKNVLAGLLPTIKNPEKTMEINIPISNLNRSFGALISGEIASRYGDTGLPKDTIKINISGIAGQSLGAFLSPGVCMRLDGAANDYVGKGMSGGRIVVTSSVNSGPESALAGNTCLYGATGGKLYVNGNVGERFAVRNSGAVTVVEGTGDHACEYMTGGTVIILGSTGINFGAGMTGGVAFVYDKDRDFIDKINYELVEAVRIDTDDMDEERFGLKRLITDYYHDTNSKIAKDVLDKFRLESRTFWMVRPRATCYDFKGEQKD